MKTQTYNFPEVKRHEYDIDVFYILDEYKNKIITHNLRNSSNEPYLHLNEMEAEFIKLMKNIDVDLNENKVYRNYIIPSSYNIYVVFLGLKILTIDPYKIEPLLSYQSAIFLGNNNAVKDNFFGLIEYLIYDHVKVKLEIFPNENIRLEKIVDWLERNRYFMLEKAYNQLQNNKGKINNTRLITMEPSFAKVLSDRLSDHILSENKHEIFNLIFKNINNGKFCVHLNLNQLIELFKRLRYQSKIYFTSFEKVSIWISENFEIHTKNDILEIDHKTVYQIFTKTDLEPKRGKIIFPELADYIEIDKRKEK